MTVALVTDSTCDLPPELIAARRIEIAPLHILWGDRSYTAGIDMTTDMFYERLARDPELPKSSQPSPGELADSYRQAIARQNADEVVCITLSRYLSGTYASAEAARSMVDFPVHVIDSKNISLTLGLIVLAAAKLRDSGCRVDEIVQAVQVAIVSSQFAFTVDTLEYLHRGGRIGGARRLIGTALSLKPILHLQDGAVEALESVRTRKRAIPRLIELAALEKDLRPVALGIIHSGAPELADVSREMQTVLQPDYLLQTVVCPPIGVHVGPGAIGFCIVHSAC